MLQNPSTLQGRYLARKPQSLTGKKKFGWIILRGQKVLDHNDDSNETPCLAVQSELTI